MNGIRFMAGKGREEWNVMKLEYQFLCIFKNYWINLFIKIQKHNWNDIY